MITVLYEDNHVIAVLKPHGVMTQSEETDGKSLFEQVKAFIKERDQKPGNVFLGIVQRLDTPVGGVVLFAKTTKGASRLSEQLREHRMTKVYWAVVQGVPEKSEGRVVQWLVKNSSTNIVEGFDYEVPEGKKAETLYKLLNTDGERSLLEVKPLTGRPHQIRVAMKKLHTPIVGDTKYGAERSLEHGAVALFSRQVTFLQPVTREPITVQAEPILPVYRF